MSTPVRALPQPADGPPVGTGLVQFGDDQPGVFIQASDATHFAIILHAVITNSPSTPRAHRMARALLVSLYDELRDASPTPLLDIPLFQGDSS